MNWKRIYIVLGITAVMLSSCGQYQKVLKTEDMAVKYEMAEKLYKQGDYSRAERLFSQIRSHYLGKPQGERILYMLADTYYQKKNYLLAATTYEKLVQQYPRSEKAEEAMFLEGKCYFIESPRYSLDQTDTYKAVDKLQNFIDYYPNSQYMREANNMMIELLTKLQQKSFEIAKGYNKIKDYQAAIKALDNFLIENPGTTFKEEAMYLKLHSAYELAINSVASKEKQRLQDAKLIYEGFVKNYPETHFKEKADKMNSLIIKRINEL
ncbi:outer membrane protein assembly factor BamD [Capnocytophaga catalasegens]|uniref:Outer membrane protein assembly factor BamD n=1 Tax=Capnocytophaga catalasegens TaxID=1004260 RepID=A0AAV5AZI0_9FLAO|nr:outer membrane protein assembly factor BamD [Capnocytophaga catalasegens]GIZ14735.1 outer membrane protein assembly factor BamD [Capnocytophaga catalasegens]GJM50583.1 outer membrane protein assembly factor BamD [Capnocytophaga catalasegens]GJM53586.1 outer membrane protein assembly factor BamD [Capnocytophaga catalasegens]